MTAQAITEARRIVDVDTAWELENDEHAELDSLLDKVLDELIYEFEDSEDKLWTAIQVQHQCSASGQLHSSAFLTLPLEMMRHVAYLRMHPVLWIPPR